MLQIHDDRHYDVRNSFIIQATGFLRRIRTSERKVGKQLFKLMLQCLVKTSLRCNLSKKENLKRIGDRKEIFQLNSCINVQLKKLKISQKCRALVYLRHSYINVQTKLSILHLLLIIITVYFHEHSSALRLSLEESITLPFFTSHRCHQSGIVTFVDFEVTGKRDQKEWREEEKGKDRHNQGILKGEVSLYS